MKKHDKNLEKNRVPSSRDFIKNSEADDIYKPETDAGEKKVKDFLSDEASKTLVNETLPVNAKDLKDSEQVAKAQDEPLPPGITEEPQHPEHLDLRKFIGYRSWLRAYISVSDDEGESIGDTSIIQEARNFSILLRKREHRDRMSSLNLAKTATDLSNRLSALINEAENTSHGAYTKHRIILGRLLNELQAYIKYVLNENWLTWVEKYFGESKKRSFQIYMRLASFPDSIAYAVFGAERLINIGKIIGNPVGKTPIGDFLQKYGIIFQPDQEADHEEIRTEADIAIAKAQLEQKGIVVPNDQLERYINSYHMIKPAILMDMKISHESGKDMGLYIEHLIGNKNNLQKDSEPEQAKSKAVEFKTTLENFLQMADSAIADSEYLEEFDFETFLSVKSKVLELEAKLSQIVEA